VAKKVPPEAQEASGAINFDDDTARVTLNAEVKVKT
jgi:hypothetical protein